MTGDWEHVMARAEELATRRRLLLGLGAAVAVALIALVAGVTRDDGSNSDVRTAAGAASTETAPGAGTGGAPSAGQSERTIGASVLGTQFTNTTTSVAPPPGGSTVITGAPRRTPAGPVPASASAGPTTTALACRNSTNPACGTFSWDPPPGDNRPIEWQLTYSPQNPKAGDKVTFHLHATDPDGGKPLTCNYSFDAAHGPTVVCERYLNVPCPTRYGRWTPPARKEGTLDEVMDHTYDQSGVYDVYFDVDNGRDCDSPYASRATLMARVNVADASPIPGAPGAP